MYRIWMALVCLWMGFSQAHSGLSEVWDKVYEALGSPVEACGYNTFARPVKIKDVDYEIYSCQVFALNINQTTQKLQKLDVSPIKNPDEHVRKLQSLWKAKGYAIESQKTTYHIYLIPDQSQVKVVLEMGAVYSKEPQLPPADGFSRYMCYFAVSDLDRFLNVKTAEDTFEVTVNFGSSSQPLNMTYVFQKGSDLIKMRINKKISRVKYLGITNCDQNGACYVPVGELSTMLVVRQDLYATKFIEEKGLIEVKDKNGKRFAFKPYCWTDEKLFSLN